MLLLALAFLIPTAYAEAPTQAQILPVERVLSIDSMITTSSKRWGVDRRVVAQIIKCESGGNPNAVGKIGEIGLVQILPSAHPELTIKQMKDPQFSIDFLARNLTKHSSWWSCYSLLYPS